MKEPIILRKTIQAETYIVQGTILRPSRRNPLIPVLMLAHEYENRGKPFAAVDLQQELLPALPVVAAKNLLDRLKGMGLLDRGSERYYDEDDDESEKEDGQFWLTELGRASAEQKIIWEPEHGAFELVLTHHHLLDQKIVALDSITKYDDARANTPIPREILGFREVVQLLETGRMIISSLEKNCQSLGKVPLVLEIELARQAITAKVKKGNTILCQQPLLDDLNFVFAVGEIMLGLSEGEYDPSTYTVSVPFDPSNLAFQRDVGVTNPQFEEEPFDDVTIKDVRHIPSDKVNAQKWHQQLVLEKAHDWFHNMEAYRTHERAIAQRFLPEYKLDDVPIQMMQDHACTTEKFYQRMKFFAFQDLNY